MRHRFEFDAADIKLVKDLVTRMSGHWLVRQRLQLNLAPEKQQVTRDWFWQVMVGCLMTSQQPSGPEDPVMRFFKLDPFPVALGICEGGCDVAELIVKELSGFRGVQYYNNIAKYANKNLRKVQGEEWARCAEQLERLRTNQPVGVEREVARFIDDHLHGFGPKQARNLLMWLGLTRYEILIDSRVMSWLNEHGFPLPTHPRLMLYNEYYEFVEDGIHELCRLCDIYPCVFDGALFSSFDESD